MNPIKVAQTFLSVPRFTRQPGTDKNVCATLLLLVAAFVLAACANSGGGAKNEPGMTVVRIWPDYRAAESFDRIPEYFTGKENTAGQIVMRTHPEARAGFYFFMRLKHLGEVAIENAQVEISVIMPDSPAAKTFLLRVPVVLRKGAILLNPGLTGPDWPWTDARTQPVAWRARLLAADGAVLASQQSYLWSK